MDIERATPEVDRDEFARTLRSLTIRLGALYWFATFVTDSIVWGIAGTDPIASASGKLFAYCFGAVVCLAISALLFRIRHASLNIKATACFVSALVAAPFFALLDFAIHAYCVYPEPVHFTWTDFGQALISSTATFFGWSCLYVALLYSFQVRDQERRLAASREEALSAQMRALRYQINPHFLFNTLNSVAALIEEGEAARAERMVLALSEFLHETLRLDPQHDVRLDDEIALQLNYLDIERERFPNRIGVEVRVPEALRSALVPSLILQPLIENAVKHGVGAGPGHVRIQLKAQAAAGELNLSIENDVPLAISPRDERQVGLGAGLGIGLRNVAERIHSRFAATGSFSAHWVTPERFRAAITLPLRAG